MYQFSYSQVLADNPVNAKEQERFAFDRAVMLLQAAASATPQGPEQDEALSFVNQLWGLLIKDLAHPGNDLPPQLRGTLMSIGLWVMGEALRIQGGQSRNFAGIAEICVIIRDGLL